MASQVQSARRLADAVYRSHFGAFVYAAFEALNPSQGLVSNWHIDAVCYRIQQMVIGQSRKRLVLNLPPRSLKSFIVSVCLPAWLLGRNPGARLICAMLAGPQTFPNSAQSTFGHAESFLRCHCRLAPAIHVFVTEAVQERR